MRKRIVASKGFTEKLHDLMDAMIREGVDEHEMFIYLIDKLPSQTTYNILTELVWESGLDLNDLVYSTTRTSSKRRVSAAKRTGVKRSGCSFDFDLGNRYDSDRIEDAIYEIFAEYGLEVTGVDFRSVNYPGGKVYSQCGIDFEWRGSTYDADEIEDDIDSLINDEGGNFFGIDFYSLDD